MPVTGAYGGEEHEGSLYTLCQPAGLPPGPSYLEGTEMLTGCGKFQWAWLPSAWLSALRHFFMLKDLSSSSHMIPKCGLGMDLTARDATDSQGSSSLSRCLFHTQAYFLLVVRRWT